MLRGCLCALAALICLAQDDDSEYRRALQELRTAAQQGAEAAVFEAMATMLAADPARTVQDAVALLPSVQELPAYYGILTSLSEMWTEEALQRLAAAIKSETTPKELRRDLVLALQLCPYTTAETIVTPLLREEGLDEYIRIAMVEEAVCRKLKEAIPALIEILRQEQSRRKKGEAPGPLLRAVRLGLVALTDRQWADAASYEQWWQANGATFQVPGRKIEGEGAASPLSGTTVVQYEALKTLDKQDVIVVRDADKTTVGSRLPWIVEELGIPCTRTHWSRPVEQQVERAKVMMVCGSMGGEVIRFSERGRKFLELVKKRVEAGLYLFTEEYGATDVLGMCFGDLLKQVELERKIMEQAFQQRWGFIPLRIWPAKGAAIHPLMKDCWVRRPQDYRRPAKGPDRTTVLQNIAGRKIEVRWEIHPSYCFYVLNPQPNVQELVVSPEAAAKYRLPSVIVAFTATFGRGRVLHTLGTFSDQRQEDKPKEERWTLIKLLINFVAEARECAER